MQNIIQKKERKIWVDTGKGLSMIFVILFHSEVIFSQPSFPLSSLVEFFRMPFFFFLSGYLFTSDLSHFSVKKKILQILRGIVWTYLVFTSAILLPKALFHGYSFINGLIDIFLGWASWFVVVLGTAQVVMTMILAKTRNIKFIWISLICALFLGFLSNKLVDGRLPFYINRTALVFFFFGLGFIYRIYEAKCHNFIKEGIKPFLFSVLLFYSIYALDRCFIHTEYGILDHPTNNFFLFIVYALFGIVMMIQGSRLLPYNNHICFVGANSIVFYYLNGGVIQILSSFIQKIPVLKDIKDLHFLASLLMVFICIYVVSLITKFLKHYCPLVLGDKKAFNRLADHLHIPVKF